MQTGYGTLRGILARFVGSVRFRLMLWAVVVIGIIVLIFGGIISLFVTSTLETGLQTRIRDAALHLSASYDAAHGRLDVRENDIVVDAGSFVVLLNGQGAVVQDFGPRINRLDALRLLALDRVQRQQEPRRTGGISNSSDPFRLDARAGDTTGYSVVFASPQRQGQAQSLLIVGFPRGRIDMVERLVFYGLLIGCSFLLLVSAIGSYWLVGRALRPVMLITRTANQISETDLRRRIAWQSRDEVGILASTFDGMLGRLEAAFERQRQFIADASHELRTPLTVINLEVNQALTRRRSSEEYERTLAIVRSENDHLVQLVNNLLMLAKADARQVTLNMEAVDLSDLALEVVERLAPLARQRSVTLSIGELSERITSGDRLLLSQLLTNMVENAVKYTHGYGGRVSVEAQSCTLEGVKWHCLRVGDDGPGIAAEHIPHLFERFYRVDDSRAAPVYDASLSTPRCGEDYAGSGLGLSIVKWVADSHGGRVRVYSVPGAGSTFEVFLRARDEHQSLDPPARVGPGPTRAGRG